MKVPELSVEELARLRNEGAEIMLIDVREAVEIATASLPGTTNIPMRTLASDLSIVPRDRDVVVMCHLGGRSERVTAYLIAQGYTNVRNLTGGIDAWSQRIDPSITRY